MRIAVLGTGTEALMLAWIRLMRPIGTPYFTWKVAR